MPEEKGDGFGGVEDREECEQVGGDCESCYNPDCPASACSKHITFLEE
jgi:hypothetical protein